MVETHAKKRPGSIAVRFGDTQVTYSALQALVDSTADDLLERTTPGELTAWSVEEPVDALATLLAAARTGRVAGPSDMAGMTLAAADHAPDPQPPFCVLRTAGVTGKPKSVALGESTLTAVLVDVAERLELLPGHRFLAPTPLSPGSAFAGLLLPLVAGAELVLVSPQEAQHLDLVQSRFQRWRPAFALAPPAVWQRLLAAGWAGAPDLAVISSGAPLPEPLARELASCTRAVWNAYGQVETSVWASVGRFSSDENTVSVGPPVAGARLEVLDGALAALPDGESGELYVGGPIVSHGYAGPSGTADAHFVPDPRGKDATARLFRTGDLAHRLPDGTIQVTGRREPVGVPAASGPPAPVSEEAQVIADAWSDLLGILDPPVHANFFELGGHSLAVMRLASRLQQAFGLPVPVADLFENLTIASQVDLVERLYEEQLAELS
ncbi:non-ribosomal peptide synthetase [Streptomyces sp. NPDC016172]|uniref:non-ribosomal peptide synthetase n=1 Tax=Streptomyces sp. NPDC016172 TaxID=3364964 RepID=UPI0037004B01